MSFKPQSNDAPSIGILVPDYPGPLPEPSSKPISKAVLNKNFKNNLIVFGNIFKKEKNQIIMSGYSIVDSKWVAVETPIMALHDRFPSQIRHEHFQRIRRDTLSLPMANPEAITLLCRDKILVQEYLSKYDIQMPEICSIPEEYQRKLHSWTFGFIKPQFGALGKNVQAVFPSSPLPRFLEGVVPGTVEPSFIQKGIRAPKGWKGLSVRQLAQRQVNGSWKTLPAVLRRSVNDFVVNVARGAEAVVAEDSLPQKTMISIIEQSLKSARALTLHPEGEHSVEFGFDFVIDQNYNAWLIEVNSRPRGRLEILAQLNPNRFASLHEEACLAPIRYLLEQIS